MFLGDPTWHALGARGDAVEESVLRQRGETLSFDDAINVDPESGLETTRGAPGELCTRGYSVMLGYWDEPEKTAQAIDASGWMHTGDLATWIVVRDGAAPITTEDVRAFCRGQLAHYKVPRYVHVTDGFPMTVTGKVRKVEMRERAVEILGLVAAARVKHA